MENDAMRILGIDPGLQRTGYGVVETGAAPGLGRLRLIEAGIVRTDRGAPLESRLAEIEEGLAAVIAEFRPDAVAVEQHYSHYKHPRTAILMGHARGVVFLAAARAGLPVTSYAATRIKKSLVGAGHASKHQVQRAIQSALGLKAVPEPADVADALAVALCHAHSSGRAAKM
jgi:crossover junction endodeoxyribonuclease RuvC